MGRKAQGEVDLVCGRDGGEGELELELLNLAPVCLGLVHRPKEGH